MRKVKSENMLAILDFLYYGEANVDQENLDSFLEKAGELKLRGVTGASGDCDNKYDPNRESPKNKDVFTKQKIESVSKTPSDAETKHSSGERIAQTLFFCNQAVEVGRHNIMPLV